MRERKRPRRACLLVAARCTVIVTLPFGFDNDPRTRISDYEFHVAEPNCRSRRTLLPLWVAIVKHLCPLGGLLPSECVPLVDAINGSKVFHSPTRR